MTLNETPAEAAGPGAGEIAKCPITKLLPAEFAKRSIDEQTLRAVGGADGLADRSPVRYDSRILSQIDISVGTPNL